MCKNLVKEVSMSKYDELKGRIEGLKNGWDKNADDIIREIFPSVGGSKGFMYYLNIPMWFEISTSIDIRNKDNDISERFYYANQCSKMSAFKSALLWLLDHSKIKKEKNLVGTEQKVEIEGKVYKARILEAE